MAKKIKSQDVGLQVGFLIFKFFLKSENLHYGLFNKEIPADVSDLKQAQKDYSELIFSNIPEGVKTILDVGCGSGETANELVSRGYEVDAVSPNALLNEYAAQKLEGKGTVVTARFEDFEIDKKYDLVLFSESFQYIPIDESIPRALNFLKEGGHILFGDFFRRDIPGIHPIGGGHNLSEWETKRSTFPLEVLFERDITEETSKTFDLVDQMTTEVLEPVWKLVFSLAEDRYPKIMKLVKWKYKKKIEKMEKKHFTSQRTGANFMKYKKYIICLMKAK